MSEAEKAIISAAKQFKIFDRTEQCHLLANCSHESGDFKQLVENLNYSPERLLKTWPGRFTQDLANKLGRTSAHPADQQAIANHAYNGRMGNVLGSNDGWTYRGRGFLQVTGRENYINFDNWLRLNNKPTGVVNNPDLLTNIDYAALSAVWYWISHKCGDRAIRDDIEGVTRIINGGLNGLSERIKLTAMYKAMLL